ncbi:hypothetical protein J2T08_002995 [Neorhizobium galegae]|nr:hypothetical protein [Neorhizobium galegae]
MIRFAKSESKATPSPAVAVLVEPEAAEPPLARGDTPPPAAPLELSSDLPPRRSKRRAAAPKKPRAVETVDADPAPLLLNLEM